MIDEGGEPFELRHKGRLRPTCVHGMQAWEMAYPDCGQLRCWWRWCYRYGLPVAALMVAVLWVGLAVGP